MVIIRTETTTRHEIPLKDLRRALRLPKWGRLSLGHLNVKNEDGTWKKVDDAIPSWDSEASDAMVLFTNYRSTEKRKRL